MVTLPSIAAAISSVAIRVLTYIFLRWIPAHYLLPAIYTFAVAYYASLYIDSSSGKPADATGGGGKAADGKASLGTAQRVLKQGYGSQWTPWLLGLPAAGSKWNWVTLSINALLVLLTLDVVYAAPFLYPSNDLSFSRLGYIAPRSALLLVREPELSKYPIYVTVRPQIPSGTWRRAGVISALNNSTDYTAPVTLEYLEPDTPYIYTLSNNLNGTFTTAPLVGLAPEPSTPDGNSAFTFLTTSCIKPNFPYLAFSHRLRILGLEHLSSLLPSLKAQFMLFLGDFIYIDVPHLASTSVSNYRSEYRRVYASPSWAGVSSLPWLHVWDDHEIANDWDKGKEAPYPAARDPFDHYHHAVNPPTEGGKTWYHFHAGPASFFMLDTRSYRSPSTTSSATDPDKTMLGRAQLSDFLTWLRTPERLGVRWKMVVSSIPFTRNWRINALDTWGGYLVERKRVLEAMWDVPLHSPGTGLVVLSGDRHEFAATRFPAPKGEEMERGDVVEFSTSPLSMFYLPFPSYHPMKTNPFLPAFLSENDTLGAKYGYEEQIAYIPAGNSKFGAVDMDEGLDLSVPAKLRFRLFIDGREAWQHELLSPVGDGAEASASVIDEGREKLGWGR